MLVPTREAVLVTFTQFVVVPLEFFWSANPAKFVGHEMMRLCKFVRATTNFGVA